MFGFKKKHIKAGNYKISRQGISSIKEDIPVEYRENPKVLSVLASHSPQDIKKREEASKKSRKQLYKKLTDGDINMYLFMA